MEFFDLLPDAGVELLVIRWHRGKVDGERAPAREALGVKGHVVIQGEQDGALDAAFDGFVRVSGLAQFDGGSAGDAAQEGAEAGGDGALLVEGDDVVAADVIVELLIGGARVGEARVGGVD